MDYPVSWLSVACPNQFLCREETLRIMAEILIVLCSILLPSSCVKLDFPFSFARFLACWLFAGYKLVVHWLHAGLVTRWFDYVLWLVGYMLWLVCYMLVACWLHIGYTLVAFWLHIGLDTCWSGYVLRFVGYFDGFLATCWWTVG